MKLPQNLKKERLLIVCSYCNKIFDQTTPAAADGNIYTSHHNRPHNIPLSHGTCPECLLKNFPSEYLMIQKNSRQRIKKSFKSKYVDITHVFSDD